MACLTLMALAAPAGAATNHVAGSSFDRPDGPAPTAIAVDEASGSVYLLSGSTLEKFDADGDPANFSATGSNSVQACGGFFFGGCNQVAVDNSGGPNQGTIYVSDLTPFSFGGKGLSVILPSGQPLPKEITTMSETGGNGTAPCGVAVEDDGDLVISYAEWFGNISVAFVDRLEVPVWADDVEAKPEVVGEYGQDFAYTCRTAIDSAENAFHLGSYGNEPSGPVRRVGPEPFGEPNLAGGGSTPESLVRASEPVDEGPVADLAVDGQDFLYTTHPGQGRIVKFDPDGTAVESIEDAQLQEPTAIAVNSATGTVYVADRGTDPGAKDVRTFVSVPVPDSLTGKFEASSATAGSLTGEADPAGAGPISACEFQYVSASAYASSEFATATTVPCEQVTPFSSATDVTAPVSGLTVEQGYAYRLRTTGPEGTSNGTVRRFTPHRVVGLDTEAADPVAPHGATLNASFQGNGEATSYYFEYGKTRVYQSTTAVADAGAPVGPAALSTAISGLDLETTYHYRVVATNGAGTSFGEDRTFRTPPAVAGVTTEPVGEIGHDSITLEGEFDGDGRPTHYYFEYGPTRAYGTLSDELPGIDAGAPNGATPVSSEIEIYRGYAKYHYRLVAVNEDGVTRGEDQTFTTLPSLAPAIRNARVSEVGETEALLDAEINPNRWKTSYLFEWGTTDAYGFNSSLKETIAGEDNQFHPVQLRITGLTPGAQYHFRAVALNFSGTTNGPDLVFTTPAKPLVEIASASALTATGARLSASVIANGRPTTVHFEYGTSSAYGSSTTPTSIGAGTGVTPVSADLSGLAPGTTYHFRVVAENEFGATAGSDVSFDTLASSAPIQVTPPQGKPKKCPKGKVKRKGKCVKKKKRTGKKGRGRGGKRG